MPYPIIVACASLLGVVLGSLVAWGDGPDGRSAKSARPAIVAHRGLMGHASENTLVAFRACLELRLGFELDVRRTKDGRLVCIHDETLDRTTDGGGEVAETTLQDFQRLDAG